MARWCKQVDFRPIMVSAIVELSLTDTYRAMHNLLRGITYTELDTPHYKDLNDILGELCEWVNDVIDSKSNDSEEFEVIVNEIVLFGEQIIKDSFLKCRKVKALCVLR